MAIAKLKLLEIEFPAQQYDAVLLKLINLDSQLQNLLIQYKGYRF